MIQGILSYQFVLNQKETGEIEPEFQPIHLEFKQPDEKKYTAENYSDLIDENDIFGIFYQHTTGVYNVSGGYSNYYTGRLKKTPYQVVSFFKQELDGSKFITITIFELDDEVEIYDDLIKSMGKRLEVLFETLIKAKSSRQVNMITKVNDSIADQLKLTIFQIDRLANLDKLQKAALIFNSIERFEILKTLRENPISKRDMKNKLERIKANPNVDVLLEPFLELNLVRRDWIKGERSKRTGRIENQGEYLFLTKDILLVRVPHQTLLDHLKTAEGRSVLFENYQKKVIDYFADFDIHKQTEEDLRKLANILLNPDVYDFYKLLDKNYYPVDKLPKIFSAWADRDEIMEILKELQVITMVEDDEKRLWVLLLTKLEPLIIFPEYILEKIRNAFSSKQITEEIAKKAYDLLELSYPEQVEF
ncbi:MAG: hypothetical protein ACTSR8_06585 [Promethearchaeota archaeon]